MLRPRHYLTSVFCSKLRLSFISPEEVPVRKANPGSAKKKNKSKSKSSANKARKYAKPKFIARGKLSDLVVKAQCALTIVPDPTPA